MLWRALSDSGLRTPARTLSPAARAFDGGQDEGNRMIVGDDTHYIGQGEAHSENIRHEQRSQFGEPTQMKHQ